MCGEAEIHTVRCIEARPGQSQVFSYAIFPVVGIHISFRFEAGEKGRCSDVRKNTYSTESMYEYRKCLRAYISIRLCMYDI